VNLCQIPGLVFQILMTGGALGITLADGYQLRRWEQFAQGRLVTIGDTTDQLSHLWAEAFMPYQSGERR
jgi:hypothetical protein